jgi:hypothetical protein
VPNVSKIANQVGKEVIKKGTPLYGVISNFNEHITSLMTRMSELSQLVEKNQEGKPVDSYNPFAGMLGVQSTQFQEGREDRNSQRQDTVQVDALFQSIEDLRGELERVQKQVCDMAVSL